MNSGAQLYYEEPVFSSYSRHWEPFLFYFLFYAFCIESKLKYE